MQDCQVLIVGGGPAGSSCAWKLRQSDIDTIVLDRSQFPRHKVCAGWITPPIIDELKLDLADYQSRLVLQPITRFLTGLIGGREIETVYGRTVSYGIRRCEFDDYLLRRSGVRLQLGEAFRSLHRDGDTWIVNDGYRARIVVGAGGHFCPVARRFDSAQSQSNGNATEKALPVVLAQEIEFEMSATQQPQCSIEPDRPELFFCPDLKGYAWVFRKGNYLNIGLGREGEEHLSSHVADFASFLHDTGKITFPLEPRFQGHAYRLRTRLPHPKTEAGVLLIGDAIGLADRQSGEGIRPAIESGLLAAQSIIDVGTGNFDRLQADYHSRLLGRFGKGSGDATSLIPGAVRKFAARQLMSTRWFTRRILLDRWFLHADDPPIGVPGV